MHCINRVYKIKITVNITLYIKVYKSKDYTVYWSVYELRLYLTLKCIRVKIALYIGVYTSKDYN